MLSLGTALLHTEQGLVTGILQSLDLLDSLSLMVYALEFDDQATASAIRDHSSLYPFDDMHLVRFVVVHGCLRAMYVLRETRNVVYRGRRPHKSAPMEKVLDAIISGSSPRTQLTQWLGAPQTYHYRFPDESVMYEAAMIGDLDAIKWIHSGTTAYTPFLAVEYAARAGHLACAQWLAGNAQSVVEVDLNSIVYGVHIHVAVPLDAELASLPGTDKQCAVLLKTDGSWKDLEKIPDPVAFAVEQVNIELLEVLMRSKSKYQWAFSQKMLVQAVTQGQLVALQWLLGNEMVPNEDISVMKIVTTAMDNAQVEILRWLDASFAVDQVPYESVRLAAKSGRLAIVKWVYERFPTLPANQDLLNSTPQYCHAHIAMWLHENKSFALNPLMLAAFIRQDDVALLRTFLKYCANNVGGEEELVITPCLFEKACGHGSLEMVQYLVEHDVWSEDGMKAAVLNSNFPVVKWLFSTGRPCSWLLHAAHSLVDKGETALATSFVARIPEIGQLRYSRPARMFSTNRPIGYYPHFIHGHQEENWKATKILAEWTLTSHPASLPHKNSLGSWAARHGYTRVIRQLIDADYPKVFSKANLKRLLTSSRDGDLVQVSLARRPELLRNHMFEWAAKYKQVKLLQFMFAFTEQNAVCMKKRTYLVIKTATKYGHLRVLKWVHVKLTSSPRAVVNSSKCAQYGHVHFLKWLRESGMLDENKLAGAMQAVVQFAQLKVLQWYEETYGMEYVFSLQELQYAVRHCDADVVAWIVRKQPELNIQDQALSHEIELLLKQWEMIEEYLHQRD